MFIKTSAGIVSAEVFVYNLLECNKSDDRGADIRKKVLLKDRYRLYERKVLKMELYTHKINYYETDRMGITHHSNYIRWMEEARLDMLERIGWGYDKLEEQGVISPVLAVSCRYRESTTYGDTVSISTAVREFKGVRLILAYEMRNAANGNLVLEGTTEHCFLDRSMRPVRLKKILPEFYEKLVDMAGRCDC